MTYLDTEDSVAIALVRVIRTGDVPRLKRLLQDDPSLARVRLGDTDPCGMSRTLLHVATDWPGHYPNVSETIAALLQAGADVNARFEGSHQETPLHWAASSNDVEALDALLAGGADINAPGAVIGGGSPLADARAFGQWRAAYRLIERGARTTFKDAATLGLLERLEDCFAEVPPPSAEEVTRAFWGACHGGQLAAATRLLARGADINWLGYDGMTPLDVAGRPSARELVGEARARELVDWLRGQGGTSAQESGAPS